MAERYHKTPSQNSTLVLPSFWHLPPTGYGEEHVRSQHTIQVSLSCFPTLPREVSSSSSHPSHYPVFAQRFGRFPRTRGSHTLRESFFLGGLWKKKSRFSPPTCTFSPPASLSCLKVPFRFNACRGSAVGLAPLVECPLRARVA